MWKTYFAIFLPAVLSLLLGAAHFWRAGMYGFSVSLVGLIFLAISLRAVWMRLVLTITLVFLAMRWVWVCGELVQVRLYMGEPWIRLACILLTVAVFTLVSAWLMHGQKAQGIFSLHVSTAKCSATAFLLVFFVFILIDYKATHVLLMHRVLPHFGILQGFFLSCWAAYVVRKLMNCNTKIQSRMNIWRIFSCVFFGQLFLGLLGQSIFLMTGKLHLPIPGIILAAPIFMGDGYFMLILFSISVLLAGGAWCSHLCYFGVWDASLAWKKRKKNTKKLPPVLAKLMPYLAPCFLVLTLLTAAGLQYFAMAPHIALYLGMLLGLLLFPAMLFITSKYGVNGYCLGICPLGVLATRTRALLPWQIRITEQCTHCQKCVHVCTSMALDATALHIKRPHATCTLCGNCMAVCKHQGCVMDFAWWSLKPKQAHAIFCVLLVSMHSIFLGVAMI